MRRVRDTDGTPAHRRPARYHMAKCRGAGPLHDQLRAEMLVLFNALKAAEHAAEDAEDVAVDTMADCDRTEVRVENAIRDIDSEAAKIDRSDPTLNARKAIFPDGFGAEIDPEGEAQLTGMPALYVRLEPFAAKGAMGTAITELQQAEAELRAAVLADKAADDAVERTFAAEVAARKAIREQLESAYGRLRDLYKSRPALAEQFFLSEGGSRRPKKADAQKAAPAPAAPAEAKDDKPK